MEKVNVTVRMDPNDVEFLDQVGALLERDRSYMLNYAVARFKEEHAWQVEQVELARREVAAGKVLTDAEFSANLNSWL